MEYRKATREDIDDIVDYRLEFVMKDHADVIQAFANAIAKGQKWVQEHTAAEIAEAIADQFPDTSVEVLTNVAQRYKDIDAWNATPVMICQTSFLLPIESSF